MGGCIDSTNIIWADGNDNVDNFLQNFDSFDDYLQILFKRRVRSNILNVFKKILNLIKRNNTLNNHKMGITPYKFARNKKVNKFFKNVN